MTGASFAQWRGSPNHYDGRLGLSVNHITLHIMVGRLSGTDSCFQRSSFQAASHYGVGGTGAVYQWVDEVNGSWADANWRSDCSGITIEHEGGMAGVPVTDAEVEASARLCADIARRYGWGVLWHDNSGNRCGNIVLHREVPGTDHFGCPDRCVNALPVDRIINRANQILMGVDMALTNDDINKIAKAVTDSVWQYKNPRINGNRDAYNLLTNMLHDVMAYKNSQVVDRDVFGLITDLTGQVADLTDMVKTLAESKGADPD